jgi:hypothetical protein
MHDMLFVRWRAVSNQLCNVTVLDKHGAFLLELLHVHRTNPFSRSTARRRRPARDAAGAIATTSALILSHWYFPLAQSGQQAK